MLLFLESTPIALFIYLLARKLSVLSVKTRRIILVSFGISVIFIASRTNLCHVKLQNFFSHSSFDTLKSLPYLSWAPAETTLKESGVTQHNRGHACPGINLYASRNLSEAYLMNMDGKILHTWRSPVPEDDSWHHVFLCENGDLLAINKDKMLIRLDENSDLKWAKKIPAHHDLDIDENGNIYVLTRKYELVGYLGLRIPIINDYVTVLSGNGQTKKQISLFKVLKDAIPPKRFLKIYKFLITNQISIMKRYLLQKFSLPIQDGSVFDILHTNTFRIVEQNIPGLCDKGTFLISARELDLIGIIVPKNEKLIWSWGPGILSKQHNPTMLENNDILIFDNGVREKRSRILELNPVKKEIVWEYQASSPEQFFSQSQGGCQRLPNGNTLITESEKGHVFEITPAKEIVWKFYNPEVIKEKRERAVIYCMTRIGEPQKKQLRALGYLQ